MKRFALTRSGVVIALAAPSFMLAWHFVALAMRPAHLNAIVSEVTSVTDYQGVWANDAGTRLLVAQETTKGWGVYFCDITGRPTRKLIYEQIAKEPGYWPTEFRGSTLIVGWSPDDSLLAYFRNNKRDLVVCNGNTGEVLATLETQQTVASATWLSTDSIIVAGPNRKMFEFHFSGGKWQHPRMLDCFRAGSSWHPDPEQIGGLVRLSERSVAWRQGQKLWMYDLDAQAPEVIWDSAVHDLRAYSVLPGTRKFLVRYYDGQADILARFHPGKTREEDMLEVLQEASTNGYRPTHLSLFNGGDGYAFVADDQPMPDDISTFVIKSGPNAAPVTQHWRYPINWPASGYAVSSNAIFIVSCQGDEPMGVWKYDLGSQALDCLFPGPERPFKYAGNSVISTGAVTNGAGVALRYFLAHPVGEMASRKYPLMIGNPGLPSGGAGAYGFFSTFWLRQHEMAANAGAFWLLVDRNGRRFEQWPEDILTVFDAVSKNPQIDTNRVFLMAISAGGAAVNSLLQARPNGWRGAVFTFSVPAIDPATLHLRRILIDGGGKDHQFNEGFAQVRQWQDDAAKCGIPVVLVVHPDVGHAYRSPVWEGEKMRQMKLMLDE